MKKMENIEQYKEVERMIDKLVQFVDDKTPVTDPNYLQLETCLNLIAEYDKEHYKVTKSRKNGSFKLVPLTDDDVLMSKEEFFEKLDLSIQQAKEGKTKKLSKEELKSLLDSL